MSGVTTLPQFQLELGGGHLPEQAAQALTEIRVQQALSQPALCELTFVVTSASSGALEKLTAGCHMRLTVSPGAALLFDGDATAFEYSYDPARGRTVRIRGYDALHHLRKRQPVRVHVQVTAADLAREMVSDLPLAVSAEEPGPATARIIQFRQSDLELLVDVATRVGLYLSLRDKELRLLTLEGRGAELPLHLGKSLLEAHFEVNAEHACRSVVARGWDTARIEPHEGRAHRPRSGRMVRAQASPARFGEDGKRVVAGEVFADDRLADARAQAELDQRSAREVTLSGTAEGDAALTPGVRVNITGVAADFEGRYVLTSVTHRFDRRAGYISEFSTSPPSVALKRGDAAPSWGVVTRVDDPEALGRVQVSLPALGTIETGWMGVLAAGAGSGKGMVALPDVGDQVLVLPIDGDLAQGIVLGGLYGVHGPGDYGVEGTSVRRYTLATPGGQRVRLDDTGQSIRLENKGGSFIDLSPQRVHIHAAVDLQIEAPGHAISITGKTIDFRQA